MEAQGIPIHRDIGASQQAGRVRGIGGRDSDADTGADADVYRAQWERLFETGQESARDCGRERRVGVHQEDGQLIATNPHQLVGVSKRARESRANLLE